MDDGSRNTEECISLLRLLLEQGVKTVIATPHFYADNESVDGFLQRRTVALESVKSNLFEGAPKIIAGAEVKYYPGISRMPELERLTLSGTDLLLLEMPFSKWTEYTVRELTQLSCNTNITFILAHIERYLGFQNPEIWSRLYESGILMQVNASFFNDFFTRKKALSLLKRQAINFIGSDCHNLTSRPPNIGKAFEIISKKLGTDFINQMNEYGYSLLS
ncbi:MAG: capsular polysaccharide biosynthesis protein [Clostridia bacterium]|nr:capsular polysaccharide biosynthesis protein [Clostridia bacterium]